MEQESLLSIADRIINLVETQYNVKPPLERKDFILSIRKFGEAKTLDAILITLGYVSTGYKSIPMKDVAKYSFGVARMMAEEDSANAQATNAQV